MDYKEKYNAWLNGPAFDEATKEELRAIENDDKEIQDRFYKDLEFGTAGIRGVIGAGSNRINKYTVAKATQGLANYILKQGDEGKSMGVVIAYDSRHMSPEFAEYTALVLNANEIKAYVFESLRPTPELSFAIRHLGCTAGVVITASHNPPEYNGYKCYWADGGQVPAPRDGEIIGEVNKIEDFATILFADKDEAVKNGLFHVIGADVDQAYEAEVKNCMMDPSVPEKAAEEMTIVYTPLHGTGNVPVMRILRDIGFKHVYVVPEQAEPDPDFSTVGYPNPEDPKVFDLAIKLAEEKGADIIVGTDPDADRVGAVVKDNEGKYIVLSGNMTGSLLTDYILSNRKAQGKLPENGVVIKTIVSSEMVRAIADAYGTQTMDVLTGFKYIGEKIKAFEDQGDHTYIFGMEESYGSLPGPYARDKDAVAATMLLCELAAALKLQGKTMYQGLLELYEKYGYFREEVQSITVSGIEGLAKIDAIMGSLRANPIKSLAGLDVLSIEDYKSGRAKDLVTDCDFKIHLPESNVLKYKLENNAWVCVRPSGTEPKIKVYFGVKGDSMDGAAALVKKLSAEFMAVVNEI